MAGFVDQLKSSDRDAFIRSLKQGDYNLLLGAGASIDSVSGDSSLGTLPGGEKLRMEINELVHGKQSTLTDAFDVALDRAPDQLHKYFVRRFRKCSPSKWWTQLVSCHWNRIWTLNVDDVVEQAFREAPLEGPRLANSYSAYDRLVEEPGTQIVHLHGQVREAEDLNLVFSIVQYVDAIEHRYAWYRKFFDEWPTLPFIVLGASLLGEYDLAQAIRIKRSAGLEAPSIFVSPNIDDSTAEQLDLRNLHPVVATAEELSVEVEELTREHRKSRYYLYQNTSAKQADIAVFSSEFDALTSEPFPAPAGHDFYQGFPPRWSDIVEKKNAELNWHQKLFDDVREDVNAETPTQVAHIVFAERLSGRTVGLLQAASYLREREIPVFKFRAEHALSVEQCFRAIAGWNRTVLIFDGVADFADEVERLLDLCAKHNVPCTVVATEYSERRLIVLQSIGSNHLKVHDQNSSGYNFSRIGGPDARSLYSKIESAGRYARLPEELKRNEWRWFLHKNVFDAMSEVEYGTGFKERVQPLVADLPNGPTRELVYLTALVGTFGYSFPVSLLNAVGLDPIALRQRDVRTRLSKLLNIEHGYLTAKYRSITVRAAFDQFETEEAFNTIFRFLRHLAPYVNAQTRTNRSIAYRLVKTVMRAKTLVDIIGSQSLKSMYDKLQDHYGHDARFWEQRSIACRLLADWAPAHSYARTAVDLSKTNSWRRTTLGGIMMLRTYRDLAPGSPESWDMYSAARGELRKAIELDRDTPVPYIVFLQRCLELYRASLQAEAEHDDLTALEEDFNDWLQEARQLAAMQQTKERADIEKLHHNFLILKASNGEKVSQRERWEVLTRKVPEIELVEVID